MKLRVLYETTISDKYDYRWYYDDGIHIPKKNDEHAVIFAQLGYQPPAWGYINKSDKTIRIYISTDNDELALQIIHELSKSYPGYTIENYSDRIMNKDWEAATSKYRYRNISGD